jgi:hypothetical protein
MHRLVILTLAAMITSSAAIAEPATKLMPLADIRQGLSDHPPVLGDNSARLPYFKALDEWALAPDTVYWDGNRDTMNTEYLDYYLTAIRRVLDEARDMSVDSGALIWKLYSSGVLVRTPEAVFAIDAVEGPFKSITRSPDDVPEHIFHWTPEMRTAFTETVDILFITHWHYDHASFALVRAMIEAGKTVVAPQQLQDHWRAHPFAARITTLNPGLDYRVGALSVRIFDGVQYMRTNEKGEWISVANCDVQNNVYLIRGKDSPTFMHNGDNRGRSFLPWLEESLAAGWTPNVWFLGVIWPRTLIADLEEITQPIVLPVHEHELGHKPDYGVNQLWNMYHGVGKERFEAGRGLIMSWGERVRVD